MPTDDLRERLLPSAARARARSASGGPAEPGDLFVLRATGDLPVEWALVDRRPQGDFLAVPADANPLAGSADVEVPATAPGGPLCLRCRFAVWLRPGLFEPGLRSGKLAPETVAEALQQVRRLEAGTPEPSPLAEEVDAESEYKDWIREVPERARALALAARPAASRKPGSWLGPGYSLAAMFALLAVGLGIWVATLHREVDRLSAPIFDISPHEVVLGETHRGGTVLEIPPKAGHVLLTLVVDSAIPPQDARFEILDAGGRRVWRSDPLRLVPGDYRLVLRRSDLPDGEYRVRIVPEAGGRPLSESTFAIQTRR
ncbi:MAG TPA: hypothetical protein VFR03_05080 [Thermoanaerobaculia bacterium]|nr:hypothetical protein [Thermoanaerobaculia bacterium]